MRDIRAAVVRSRSVVYQAATGSGKTVCAGDIARRAAQKGKRTMLLVHRRELIRQSVNTLREFVPGVEVGVEAAGWPSVPWAPLQVGGVQSVVRRPNIPVPDLVIVDEAHHVRAATWEKILARWPGCATVGLTATPERLDGKGLGEHFREMVAGPTIQELVKGGYLAPTRTLRIKGHLLLAGVKKRGGDYQRADLADRVTDAVVADAVDAYERYARGRRAIFFGITIKHSKEVAARMQERGIRAEHVDGTDHASRRDRVMGEFRDGAVQVVCNCDLISEGYDAPGCDAVLLGMPTQSVTRYLQAAGRAMRYQPGKTALILDLTGISYDLGLPDDVRQWSLEDGELRDEEKKAKKRRTRDCERCMTAYYGVICPACGHEPAGRVVEHVAADLEEATSNGVRPRPRRGRLTRKEMNRLLYAARNESDPEAALLQIAADHGYRRGWVGHILRVWGMTA